MAQALVWALILSELCSAEQSNAKQTNEQFTRLPAGLLPGEVGDSLHPERPLHLWSSVEGRQPVH